MVTSIRNFPGPKKKLKTESYIAVRLENMYDHALLYIFF
jgi:hypothetical protein